MFADTDSSKTPPPPVDEATSKLELQLEEAQQTIDLYKGVIATNENLRTELNESRENIRALKIQIKKLEHLLEDFKEDKGAAQKRAYELQRQYDELKRET